MRTLNRTLLLSAVLINSSVMAQFPVIGTTSAMIRPLQTLASGPRFMDPFYETSSTLTIYETDLTVHRVLQWPAAPAGMEWAAIGWITEDLFDTDPSTIEFVLQAYNFDTVPNSVALGIYREDGTQIFFQNPGMLTNGVTILHSASPIFHETGITKMVVHGGVFGTAPVNIYQLPGQLPCLDCMGTPQGSGMITGGGTDVLIDSGVRLFPNPTATDLNVVISADDQAYSEIRILDASGKVVHIQPIAGTGTHVFSISQLSNGAYTCQVSGNGLTMFAGRFVVSR